MPPRFRSRRRRVAAAVLSIAAVATPVAADAAACWAPPVSAPIVDPFQAPACRWCPGNRGIEYGSRWGQSVRAVDTGRVTFSGTVAGVRYLVVEHRDGRRATYGRLATVRYGAGDLVLRGRPVGTARTAFHFGLREGERYLDPAPFIGRYVGRPRLVPLDGSTAAPAPPPRLRCGR